jgi:hypothetical protein
LELWHSLIMPILRSPLGKSVQEATPEKRARVRVSVAARERGRVKRRNLRVTILILPGVCVGLA